MSYTSGLNLVFCRNTSETMWWIRFAESVLNDGSDGPHLDIDLCNPEGNATFGPMDPRGQPCPGGLTWGIWWHDGQGGAFANRPDASPCELSLIVAPPELSGAFSCLGLVNERRDESLDVLGGSFRFRLDQGFPLAPAGAEVPDRGAV